MRLLLLTAGSRGDVEPFAALARRASARGHDVLLVGPAGTAASAGDGVEVRELDVDYRRMMQEQGTTPRAALRDFRRVIRPAMREVIVGAARRGLDFEPDVVLHHPKVLSAPLLASRLRASRVVVELVPTVTPTSAFPAAGTARVSVGPLNRLTFMLAGAAGAMFRAELREASALLGDPEPRAADATLVPVSPQILERPRDWPSTVHVTGSWDSPGDGSLPPEIDAFLSGGDAISVGFGSMAKGDPHARGAALLAAARARGLRTLVMRGWGGADVPDHLLGHDVMVVDGAPHAAVLPRVRVAVHHGGAGTSHAAARAGTPAVVVPFLADQPFWAAALHRRGLAAAPLPLRRLTEGRAGAAIDDALDLGARAAEIGARIGAEDGAGVALDVLERLS